jgi:hypothetical protein
MRDAPAELRRYLSAFDPAIARLFLAARRLVLASAPKANELVYDAYNAVSVAFSFSDRLKEAFCHVAAYPGHVNLGFNRGAELADPARVLAGSGARIRHVRLDAPADLKSPALRALVRAAVRQGRALAPRGAKKPASIVRPVSGAKRRPRSPRG